MADAPSPLHDQLQALYDAYAAQLPSRIDQIEAAWAALQQSAWEHDTLNALYLLTHKLAGSGATFGFVPVSETAARLEQYLQGIIGSAVTPTAEQQAQISAYLGALKQVVIEIDQQRHPHAPVAHIPSASSPRHEQADRMVFLVEDDLHLAQDLTLQIEHFGYTVRTFPQLAGLQESVHQTPPAAIIMNIIFPEGNLAGVDTIVAIQHMRAVPIPVIFISARIDLTARLQAVRAGGNAYFTKPVDVSGLIDTLDRLTTHHPPDPYRILIIEDEPDLAAYYASILQQVGMATVVITDPLRVMQPLIEFRPDLILMDLYMPGCNGLELASVIRQQGTYVSIPIVFLSTETDLDKQLAAMRLGGDDFLTKPIQPDHLIASVATRVQRLRILRSFMVRDSLTGLLNYTTIKEQLSIEAARARRQQAPLTFAMIDIDHFKSVNDTYGHPTGDRVLKSLARLLQQRLRQTDIIGRYGGEEFAVILTDTDVHNAAKVLEELRTRFAQVRQQAEDTEFYVTLSCGIAGIPPYSDATALNEAADKALYEAKHGGRNRVVIAGG